MSNTPKSASEKAFQKNFRLNAEILEGLDSEILALNTEITSLISNLEKVYE